MKQWQQGDTLYFTEPIPNSAIIHLCADGVIQWGEVTNHAHRIRMFRHGDMGGSLARIESKTWEMLRDKNSGARYLRVKEPIEIDHEEHKTIMLPPGEYRIGIIQEYDHFAEEARRVQD